MRLALGPRSFDLTTRALVVAVLNPTPNSPSRPGQPSSNRSPSAGGTAALLDRAEICLHEGADVLEVVVDPNDASVPPDLSSLTSLVGVLVANFELPVAVTLGAASLGTASLGAVLDAGATMIRPIGGAVEDAACLNPLRQSRPAIVLPGMSTAESAAAAAAAAASIEEASAQVTARARRCEKAGFGSGMIVVDTGSGAPPLRLAALGYPLMMSTSPADDPSVSVARIALGVIDGCRLVRTTHVRSARRVVDTLAAIMEAPQS